VSSECVRQFFAAVTSTAARRGLQRSHHPRVGFHKSGRNKRTGDGHVERRERITSVVSVTISGFPKGINSSPASLARSYYISTTVTGRSPAIKKTPFPECAARCLLYSTGFTLPFVRFSIKRRFNSVSQAVASLPDSGPRRYRSQISSVTLWSFFSIHSMNSPHAPPSP
jgi:hypothetical protein